MSEDEAQRIAVAALLHVASDEALMTRFISITGIDPGEVRRMAADPAFLAGVLEFLLGHEPDAVAFAEEASVAPEDVGTARVVLSGGTNPDPWQSV